MFFQHVAWVVQFVGQLNSVDVGSQESHLFVGIGFSSFGHVLVFWLLRCWDSELGFQHFAGLGRQMIESLSVEGTQEIQLVGSLGVLEFVVG